LEAAAAAAAGGGVEDSVVYSRWRLGSGGCLRVLGGVLITCLGVGHQVGMFLWASTFDQVNLEFFFSSKKIEN